MAKLMNEASIPELLDEMTVEEKVDLIVGKSFFTSQENEKYGIPSILYLDGATGVNIMQYVLELMGRIPEMKRDNATEESNNESGSSMAGYMPLLTGKAPLPEGIPQKAREIILKLRGMMDAVRPNGEEPGCFPPGMLLGATWKPEVVYQVGEAVAREAIAYGVDVLLGTPNTNIHRDPRNGRLFESFSEDPYLSARMAAQFPLGVQAQGMVADVKHFAANNQETMRQGINELISERALREIYLPGFEAAVKEGRAETVMSAYNSINGIPCAQNKWLLTQVLKEEWGFEGQVVSDWGAVYDQVEALNAGNDMDMPGPRGKAALLNAVKEGVIEEERLNDAAARMLRLILKTPAFRGRKFTAIDSGLSERAAYTAACEGITLLKNNGVLPLGCGKKVSLYGKRSRRFMESGSGSAQVDTCKFTSLYEEMKSRSAEVLLDEIGKDTEVVVITAGASGQEGSDRPDMDFDREDKAMLKAALAEAKAAGRKTVLLLNVAGPVELTDYLEDVDAILCLFFPGMQGAKAAAEILCGQTNPCGKLPLTFPKKYRDCPTSLNFPGEFGRVCYGEGIYVGYRYYDTKGIEPLYPFGYGLSYTSFEFSGMKVSQRDYSNASEAPLTVSVDVTNTGEMAGSEVVQLYIHDPKSALDKPEKELKAFAKVRLEPGETKSVELQLVPQSFASYDESRQGWTMETGVYELLVGNSSRNISLSERIRLVGKNPYGITLHSGISTIVHSPEALEICRRVLGENFDTDHIIGQSGYFGLTPLGMYLENTGSCRALGRRSRRSCWQHWSRSWRRL